MGRHYAMRFIDGKHKGIRRTRERCQWSGESNRRRDRSIKRRAKRNKRNRMMNACEERTRSKAPNLNERLCGWTAGHMHQTRVPTSMLLIRWDSLLITIINVPIQPDLKLSHVDVLCFLCCFYV